MKNLLTGSALLAGCLMARAHEGHGLHGAHWHATDAVGFLVAGGVAAAIVWWSRRK